MESTRAGASGSRRACSGYPRIHVRYEATEEDATDALLLPEMKEAYLAADQVAALE